MISAPKDYGKPSKVLCKMLGGNVYDAGRLAWFMIRGGGSIQNTSLISNDHDDSAKRLQDTTWKFLWSSRNN